MIGVAASAALPGRRLVRPSKYALWERPPRLSTSLPQIFRSKVRWARPLNFFYNKRQFIFLTCVLGLGLVLSISGFVVVQGRSGITPWQPWSLLAGGLLLTGLLLAYITAALGRTATVEQLVGLRTQELLQANEQLVEEVAIRRQIEARLQGSEAGIRAILDATVDGIITIDEEGTIESFNSAAENIFA